MRAAAAPSSYSPPDAIRPARARILGMVRSTSLVALAGLACAFAAGCGDDSKPDAAEPQPAKANLEQFLMQAGEEPGFDLIESARVDSGVESLGLTAAGIARLRRSGFISIAYRICTATPSGTSSGSRAAACWCSATRVRAPSSSCSRPTRGRSTRALTASVPRDPLAPATSDRPIFVMSCGLRAAL